ncbi:MAG TPA: ADP-ribosylglycohydrolase family protein [Spirochaetia bacterium]|nr:ADP-ribosylglycohydrolase family protein [Spirochaetia bacterium]
MTKQQVFGGIFGLCVGDALGVPVEFRSREFLASDPVRDMIGFGTHNQPPGTWSDDSALALCLAESLCNGFNPADAGARIVRFAREAYWTPFGRVFDIGNTTKMAAARLADPNIAPEEAGLRSETDNGNGSLMRILPLAFALGGLPFPDRMEHVSTISSLTHGHPRSVVACTIYVETAVELLAGRAPDAAYHHMRATVHENLRSHAELAHFRRILEEEIATLPQSEIESGGYVVHTLEAALWSFLTSNSYSESVLKAVNLGGDSDTTGAVTGGLAGLAYGFKAIPKNWVEQLPRKMEIGEVAEKLYAFHTGTTPRVDAQEKSGRRPVT